MITTLAPLGAKNNIHISLVYSGENVAATIMLSAKAKDDAFSGITPLVFSGPVAEVEATLIAQLPIAVAKLTAHGNNMAELDAQLEAQEKVKADTVAAEIAKAKAVPVAKPVAGKPAAVVKPVSRKAGKPLLSVATEKPTEHAEPKATPVVPGLTPAWKKAPAPAEPLADLGSLFGDEPNPTD